MESKIIVDNASLQFTLFHSKGDSIKDLLTNLIKRKKALDSSKFWALKNINLTINTGDRVGIIGHNGAGKSTLLKTIAKIYTPSQGKITTQGRLAPLLEIGAGFHPELTGRENIYLNGAILGFKKSEIAQFEQNIIDFTELEEFIDTPVKYYSTGMYMKLGFGIATAVHPDILLLDELFAGGDQSFIKKAEARMEEFIEKSSIMILVSHDNELIRKFCNRVIWMDHGAVIADGPTDEIMNAYSSR